MPGSSSRKLNLERAKELYPSCRGLTTEQWLEYFSTHLGEKALALFLYEAYDNVLAVREKAAGKGRRSGRRPKRPHTSLDRLLDVVAPTTFTTEPFPAALKQIIYDESHEDFAARVPCTTGQLAKWLSGAAAPDVAMMERLAAATDRPGVFFVEVRAQLLGELVAETYCQNPARSITILKDLLALRGQ